MAKKAESFKVIAKTKTIILYTNVEQNDAEKTLVEFYLNNEYTPMFEEKKKGVSVDEMRKALNKDAEALKRFEEAYKKKNGFFEACKIYSAWKKENK